MRWIAIALAALVALGTAVPALADDRPKSRIVIKKLKHSGATGKVKSNRSSCRAGRKVSLFRLEGFRSNKVAITHSRSGGKWRVKKDLRSGRYFAKVDAGGGCRYDNSKTERLR
jgi:hypothetical protein